MNGDDFEAKTQALLKTHGNALLALAKASIVRGLESGNPLEINTDTLPAELSEPGACFVTLKLAGDLRGCIGSPQAWRGLAEDVAENAFRAAFRDPRFDALSETETGDDLTLSISVLSPATPMLFTGEADFLSQLRPGVDGLIIGDGANRALFLPSVWEQLPEPAAFVQHLKVKAGLTRDHWSDTFIAERFIAAEIKAHWTEIPAVA